MKQLAPGHPASKFLCQLPPWWPKLCCSLGNHLGLLNLAPSPIWKSSEDEKERNTLEHAWWVSRPELSTRTPANEAFLVQKYNFFVAPGPLHLLFLLSATLFPQITMYHRCGFLLLGESIEPHCHNKTTTQTPLEIAFLVDAKNWPLLFLCLPRLLAFYPSKEF